MASDNTAPKAQNATKDSPEMQRYEKSLIELFRESLDGILGKSEPLPPELYHYTTAEAAIGILTTKSIWATHERFMNDPSEGFHGRDIAMGLIRDRFFHDERAMETFKGSLDAGSATWSGEFHVDAYIASFSAARDLLSQWRAYSHNGQGICVGIDPESTGYTQRFGSFAEDTVFMRVQYDPNAFRRGLEDFIDRGMQIAEVAYGRENPSPTGINKQAALNRLAKWFRILMQLSQRISKQPGYAEEQEWRLVHIRMRPEFPYHQPDADGISFRAARGQVLPYVELPLAKDRGVPIKSVWLGPASTGEEREIAMSMLLRSKGLNSVNLIKSATQYRAS